MALIVLSVVSIAALGLISGIGLGYAYQKFHVEEDPKVAKIQEALPGANCGACGFPGCRGFAEAVAAGKVDPTGCLLGGEEISKVVSAIMGLEHKEKDPISAFPLCNGGKANAAGKFEYQGVKNCKAAHLSGGGYKSCSYGCLGFGDCERICPVDAIHMSYDALPVVDILKCIACGKCIEGCPRMLFVLLPKKVKYHVDCASHDKGAVTRKVCKVGCIACSLCINACPVNAIDMVDNLAVINQGKCINCGDCFKVCPTNTIVKFDDRYQMTTKTSKVKEEALV